MSPNTVTYAALISGVLCCRSCDAAAAAAAAGACAAAGAVAAAGAAQVAAQGGWASGRHTAHTALPTTAVKWHVVALLRSCALLHHCSITNDCSPFPLPAAYEKGGQLDKALAAFRQQVRCGVEQWALAVGRQREALHGLLVRQPRHVPSCLCFLLRRGGNQLGGGTFWRLLLPSCLKLS